MKLMVLVSKDGKFFHSVGRVEEEKKDIVELAVLKKGFRVKFIKVEEDARLEGEPVVKKTTSRERDLQRSWARWAYRLPFQNCPSCGAAQLMKPHDDQCEAHLGWERWCFECGWLRPSLAWMVVQCSMKGVTARELWTALEASSPREVYWWLLLLPLVDSRRAVEGGGGQT